jgi:branched-chain amino acid transport system ATP-binding protein
MTKILEVIDVTKSFGGLKAVDNVSLSIEKGEIVGLIGPNGAGKTTLFNLISGIYSPDQGKILFKGFEIQGRKPHDIARLGIARTFQIVRPFKDLNVLQNVLIAYGHGFYNISLQSFSKYSRDLYLTKCMKLLRETGLEGYEYRKAKTLPIALLRRLEIARALALNPDLVMLDEPASGLVYKEYVELMKLIQKINREGKTVFLIEHNMEVAMGICEKIFVINYGKLLAEGKPDKIKSDSRVLEAYLGREK